MLNLRELIDVFRGTTPMDDFAGQNISLSTGALTYAMAFVVVGLLIALEVAIFTLVNWFGSGADLIALAVGIGLVLVGAVVAIPLLLIVQFICIFILGAVYFYIAKFFSNKPNNLNDFNGSLMSLFASVKFVEGVVFLIPLLGWLAAGLVHIYGIVLTFRFIKSRFNLTDVQGAIVILLPLDIMLGLILVVAVVISVALVGSRII